MSFTRHSSSRSERRPLVRSVAVVLACAVAIALLRPSAEAERFRTAGEMDGLVRRILEEHMERASEE